MFKNRLAAVPYQEVLLTTHGYDLRRIHRTEDSVLHMEDLTVAPAGDEPPVPDVEHQHNAETATDGAEEMAWR